MSKQREELLEELRPPAFAIAYRMLGSVAEAEDIVQEALLQLHRALEQGERISSPRAEMATVTTRLALDELRSARSRREHYAAAEKGDLGALEALLAQDVVLHGDGGGKVRALARSLHGRSRVARTLLAWAHQGLRLSGAVLHQVKVNGQPGALLLDGTGKLIGVMALDIAGGQIQAVSAIVNPDKLRHIGPIGDLQELLEREEGV
jgi:RNA polymerase sigma factor (sigma-70 family)